MTNLFKIAIRNLMRYKRRTLLTASLITIGVVFVLVFISVSGSFKNMMVGQITDSMLGHIQIHRKGYVASIDTLPLTLNLKTGAVKKLENILGKEQEILSFSPRIKFGAMFSNFSETSNIRLNGIDPEKEFATVPLLTSRMKQGKKSLHPGEIIVPELLAKGMKVKIGDTIVIVATNQDGSVNGKQFTVSGVIESIAGPGGRDGYIHLEDAGEILRMDEPEISEIAVRLKNFEKLDAVTAKLEEMLSKERNKMNKAAFEVHPWKKLSPFYNISRMIDMLTFFIKLMLIAIVLISIMNVMIMAVYERIREIGTLSAIGTLPSKILSMFVIEGFCLGLFGGIIGNIIGIGVVAVMNISKITFNFGMQKGLVLTTRIYPGDFLAISATVIIVSVIASLQPAFKASRMDPIDALRHV
ncbi:MAG: ABC transporter permease [Desulfococcaceae bacterium]|jgi:putative ABC transport system permease protein|nr:ABC transporter permease [Desulfococcaceae bacterium]